MSKRVFKVWRGDAKGATSSSSTSRSTRAWSLLDVLHRIQAHQANDLAPAAGTARPASARSCSMEINGKPRLACMTRMNVFTDDETITCQPAQDVSPADEGPRPPTSRGITSRTRRSRSSSRSRARPTAQVPDVSEDVDRVQELPQVHRVLLAARTCCHVLRDRPRR